MPSVRRLSEHKPDQQKYGTGLQTKGDATLAFEPADLAAYAADTRPGPAGGLTALHDLPNSPDTVVLLQRVIGNASTLRLLRSGARVQRAWSDAKPGGWNASEQMVGRMRRIPIEGLNLGNQTKAERSDVKEAATGRAIVLIPAEIDPAKPVEVMLFLHGHGAGNREKGGQVQDVAEHRIAQQIEAVSYEPSAQPGAAPALKRQMIGVLPQGGLKSQFGPTFKADDYLAEVFSESEQRSSVGPRQDRPRRRLERRASRPQRRGQCYFADDGRRQV